MSFCWIISSHVWSGREDLRKEAKSPLLPQGARGNLRPSEFSAGAENEDTPKERDFKSRS